MTSLATDVIDVALRVARALEAAGGEYFVGGSLASSLQGEPRATNDIDFVIDLPIGRVSSFVRELGADFEIDTDQLIDAIRHGSCANAFYLPWDSVLHKLSWYRQGGEVSERQWRDVQGVLRAHTGALDEAYLDRWAGALDVTALLAKARREASS